jgi:hypothetical protein
VLVNLTAVNATAPTFISRCTESGSPAATSLLNVEPRVAVANLAIVDVGWLALCTHSGGVDLIVDVLGYFVPFA